MSGQQNSASGTGHLAILGVGVALLLVLVCCCLYLVAGRVSPSRALPIGARLELVAGEVTVDSGDGAVRALSGMPLVASVKLGTGKGARALVRLPDGSKLFVRDSSSLQLRPESVTLERGEYWLDTPLSDRKPLLHESGAVSISMIDAGASIKRDGALTLVYVARGMAIVAGKGRRVEAKAGEEVRIKGNESPRIFPVAFWDDWTGGMADFDTGGAVLGAGSGTLYGVDELAPRGAPTHCLEIKQQAVRAVVRGGLSETEVDQTFLNPGEHALEGWFWFRVPEGATVTGFALETNGKLVEGELIESREALAQYAAPKSLGRSPAILEWVNDCTYRARISPLPPGSSPRIVTRYAELRPVVDSQVVYVYPMAHSGVRIGEFSLAVDLGESGKQMRIATAADARIEAGGQRVTMRRSGYTPRSDFLLEGRLPEPRPALTVARYAGGGDTADYLLARYTPDVDWQSMPAPRGEMVLAVDTSAGGDETSRQLKTAIAEAILRALSGDDRFALVSVDTKASVLYPAEGLAPASDQEIAKALGALADHGSGGATDLAALFDVSFSRLHGAEQPAVVYVGDGIATLGEMTGEQIADRLRRALATSRARLFTVPVGADANRILLGELARAGGGGSFSVSEADATTARALELIAAVKAPTITEFELDLGAGLDEVFSSANSKLSRGSELVVLARSHHELPREVKVRGRVGGTAFEKTYPLGGDKTILQAFVPRLWAAEYVRRLIASEREPEAERGRIVALGLEYGLVTPYTSFLALESESSYRELGIQRKTSKLRGERLNALDRLGEKHILEHLNAATSTGAASNKGGRYASSEPSVAAPSSLSSRWESRSHLASGGDWQTTLLEPLRGAPSLRRVPTPAPLSETDPAPASHAPARDTAARPDLAATRPTDGAPPMGDEGLTTPQDRSSRELAGEPKKNAATELAGAAAAAVKPPTGMESDAADGARVPLTRATHLDNDALEASAATGNGSLKPDSVPLSTAEIKTCSDAAARPLADRLPLWKRRLRTAKTPDELVERYNLTFSGCELQGWRAESSFLELMEKQVDSETAARIVLSRFSSRPEVQRYLGKLILRRAVDQHLAAAVEKVLFGTTVQWDDVDRRLGELERIEDRITRLREFIARAPDDPNGSMRLIPLLVEADRKEEAVMLGRRLREQGLMTPLLARLVGDALAQAGLPQEALRTYSEIVEFDRENGESRRLLGDIYLSHSWYEPAYRQYKTLTDSAPSDALAWLRLAAAAAGSGRIDEALRLERHVASAQGTPGPQDPRRWARLLSGARLARLLQQSPAAPLDPDSRARIAGIKRELKQLELFGSPGTLVLLTWENLSLDLTMTTRAGKEDLGLGVATDAARAGLAAVWLAPAEVTQAVLRVRVRGLPSERAVSLRRQDIAWDGKDFRVAVSERQLAAHAKEMRL